LNPSEEKMRSHDTFVKRIKNAVSGWQDFSKTLEGKELKGPM